MEKDDIAKRENPVVVPLVLSEAFEPLDLALPLGARHVVRDVGQTAGVGSDDAEDRPGERIDGLGEMAFGFPREQLIQVLLHTTIGTESVAHGGTPFFNGSEYLM